MRENPSFISNKIKLHYIFSPKINMITSVVILNFYILAPKQNCMFERQNDKMAVLYTLHSLHDT